MPRPALIIGSVAAPLVLALSTGLVTIARPASGAQVPRSYIYVTGELPKLPTGKATLLVEVERHAGTGPHGVAKRLVDTVVATKKVTSRDFRVTVFYAKAIVKAEIHGEATFVVVAFSGRHSTLKQGSTQPGFRASAATTTAAATHRNLSLGKFGGWKRIPKSAVARTARVEAAASPGPPPPCTWVRWGLEKEGITRIGEFHLTRDRGMKLKWVYGSQSDTTMSVGYSGSPSGSFSVGGTYTATSTIGANSGFSKTNHVIVRYIDGEAYLQRYRDGLAASCDPVRRYKLTLDHMVGTSFLGNQHPKPNPYGGCLNDPYGKATIHPGQFFDSDRAKAATEGNAATVFGFTFSESTGFSGHAYHDYINNSHHTHYLCGTTYMSGVPILYNDRV